MSDVKELYKSVIMQGFYDEQYGMKPQIIDGKKHGVFRRRHGRRQSHGQPHLRIVRHHKAGRYRKRQGQAGARRRSGRHDRRRQKTSCKRAYRAA